MALTKILKAASKATKKLPKKPSTVKESADKARHHHAASVKALTRQQQVIREEAKKAGMRVNAYKEKFPNKASVKKLKELQKQMKPSEINNSKKVVW